MLLKIDYILPFSSTKARHFGGSKTQVQHNSINAKGKKYIQWGGGDIASLIDVLVHLLVQDLSIV